MKKKPKQKRIKPRGSILDYNDTSNEDEKNEN